MKLASLLAQLSVEQIERLATEHLRTEEQLSRPAICSLLEGVLRSFRFLQDFLFNRQPPTFSIVTALLEAPENRLPCSSFREIVLENTARICKLVSSEEILGRDDQLRVYRRVLYVARQSDMTIDASESAILSVLRSELAVSQVEHFLLEHHAELREFWVPEGGYTREMQVLQSAGIVFTHAEHYLLAEDMAPLLGQAIGIDMPSSGAQRLFELLSNEELSDALNRIDAKTSGTKEERVNRLVLNRVQPRLVLSRLGLESLKDICRAIGVSASASKEELTERIIRHFASGLDLLPPQEAPPPRQPERRLLDERRFKALFESLRGGELTHVLEALPDLRQSGSKEVRATTLWNAQLSEETLLSGLKGHELEDVLYRLGLKLAGAKRERIERLVQHFATASETVQLLSERSSNEEVSGDRVEPPAAVGSGDEPPTA